MADKKDPSVLETVVGFTVLAVAAYFGWQYFFGKPPHANTPLEEITLADYKRMSTSDRGDFLKHAMAGFSPEALDEFDQFRTCLGYNAPRRREDLTVLRVLGWCDAERINAPDRFASRFNDLEAADLSEAARNHCRSLARSELIAPATARFAVLDRGERHVGSWEYKVWGSVNSDNLYGVTFTFRFYCTMQYHGAGDPASLADWDVSEFTIEQARG